MISIAPSTKVMVELRYAVIISMPVTELFFDDEKWVGLQSVGLIESVRKIDGETTTNKRYYLNSFNSDAQLLGHAVRSHWGVENNVHVRLGRGF